MNLDFTPILSLIAASGGSILFIIGVVGAIRHRMSKNHKDFFIEIVMTLAGVAFIGLGVAGVSGIGAGIGNIVKQLFGVG